MIEDFDRCYRAVSSKDPRFDGWFFTAVTSTGIYCRPSCPAMTPKASNVRFYATAAAAQHAGFRACKRCRPDAAPGSPEWDSRADVVARAMRLIGDGVVDREGVPGLASRLGYSTRQVERLLLAGVGASPLALARAQRAQTARILIETTGLPLSQVAFAAGFASIRQFNDTVRAVFALAPGDLRRRARRAPSGPAGRAGAAQVGPAQTVCLRLPFRQPLEPVGVFGHLAATAVPGVEEVRDGAYRRTLALPRGHGIVSLRPAGDHVAAAVTLGDLRDLTAAISRARRLLDLDADPEAVDAHLGLEPALSAAVAAARGQRVPRTVDEAEMAVRAVLGQQITTAAARTHAGRLSRSLGDVVDDPVGTLDRTFPTPDALAGAAEAELALPTARRSSLRALATALAEGTVELGPGVDWSTARAQLGRIPGVGTWTVEIVAMRALGDPDAFPVGDLGLRRAAAAAGLPAAPGALAARAEAWRPWRAYATQYLWRTLDHPVNHPVVLPDERQKRKDVA